MIIMVWNVAGELVKLKNITVGLNDPSGVVNAAFHLFSPFIHILLYSYHKSNLLNTLFVSMFYMVSEIKGKE